VQTVALEWNEDIRCPSQALDSALLYSLELSARKLGGDIIETAAGLGDT